MITKSIKNCYFSIIVCILLLLSVIPLSTFPSNAAESEYDSEGATKIVFSDNELTVTEGEYDGYKIEETDLTIEKSGTYILSGNCTDGSVTVKKGTTGVTLVLKGLTLENSDTAPISCNKSTEVIIIAAAGSKNSLTDSVKNNDNEYSSNKAAENAVIKCKDGSKVTLCGSGTLNIAANGYNGIKSGATTEDDGEAQMTIKDLTLNITATVNDAINAEATLSILSGKLTISAADDGIHSDYYLNIGSKDSTGPTISVEKSNEGIEGATINIYSGDISTNSTDDGINAANSDLSNYDFSINISGGNVYINTPGGDGIDSNGSITISGGTTEIFSATSGDNQPLDCDGTLNVTGGTVLAVGSSGMGTKIGKDSTTYVIFGNNSGGIGFGGGGNPQLNPNQQDSQNNIPQNNGDGTQPPEKPDSQNITPPDGENGVQPPERPDMQPPNDQNGQRPELPDNDNFSGEKPDNGGQGRNSVSLVTAGNTISIKDSSNKTIYSAKAVRDAEYVFFSSEKLETSKTYSLVNGSEESATATSQSGESGNSFGPGNITKPTDNNNKVSKDSTFSDVSSNDWYYNAVSYVYGKGLMNGVSSDSFGPNSQTTRGMIVTILYRLSGESSDNCISDFADVAKTSYYYDAVAWAATKGIVTGYSSSTFAPDDKITREQLATIIYRYNNLFGKNSASEKDVAKSISDYTDSGKISSYAKDSLEWAIKKGIISGTDSGNLEPQNNATRAQVATILMRFCSL